MKKLFLLFLIVALVFTSSMLLFSCGEEMEQIIPNADPEKAKAGLIKAKYDEFLESDIKDYLTVAIEAEKNDVYFDGIRIYYYKSPIKDLPASHDEIMESLEEQVEQLKSHRERAFEHWEEVAKSENMTLEKFAEKYNIDLNYYRSLEYSYGYHDNIVWFGTTLAIEAAQ